MDLSPSNRVNEAHWLLWRDLKKLAQQGMPQSLLFLGPEHVQGLDLIRQLTKLILCESENSPCDTCRSCRFIDKGTHPDVLQVTQEKPTAAIKIDQIRAIQQDIYQTPQCSAYRLVVIHPADELNRSAANALLKILEEPPKHVVFILLAHHVDTLPATILSRCQCYHIPEPCLAHETDLPRYLRLGLSYSADSSRGVLFKHQQEMIQQLCALSEGQSSVCQVASMWSRYGLSDCLWFFQLFTSSLLQHQLLAEQVIFKDVRVQALAQRYSPVHVFKQWDAIQALIKKTNQDIPLNPTLALESLLMEYT